MASSSAPPNAVHGERAQRVLHERFDALVLHHRPSFPITRTNGANAP